MDFTPLLNGIRRLIAVIETNNQIQEKALAMLAARPGGEIVPAAATVPASPAGTVNPVHQQPVPETVAGPCDAAGPMPQKAAPGSAAHQGPGTAPQPTGIPQSSPQGKGPVALDYETLSLSELKTLCKERGIELKKGTKTPTYIAKLNEWDRLHPTGIAPPKVVEAADSDPGSAALTQEDILAALTAFRDAAQTLPLETVHTHWPTLAGIPGQETADVNAVNIAILWVRQLMSAGTGPGETVPDVRSIKPENYEAVLKAVTAKKAELGIQ